MIIFELPNAHKKSQFNKVVTKLWFLLLFIFTTIKYFFCIVYEYCIFTKKNSKFLNKAFVLISNIVLEANFFRAIFLTSDTFLCGSTQPGMMSYATQNAIHFSYYQYFNVIIRFYSKSLHNRHNDIALKPLLWLLLQLALVLYMIPQTALAKL